MGKTVNRNRIVNKLVTLSILLLLIKNVASSCNPHDYETVLGGYPEVHEVNEITFDVHPETLDIVVAGEAAINDGSKTPVDSSFIYFVSESSCQVEWIFFVTDLSKGIYHVAFDPTNPTKIYGIGSSDQGRDLFWIENSNPATTSEFYRVTIVDSTRMRELKAIKPTSSSSSSSS